MILAGGLGSSVYVRETIQDQLQQYQHPNARRIIVVPCQEPQLIVVRGLLLDRQQKMQTGNMSVLATRIARMSYGVMVQERYNPVLHFDEDVREDAFNPKERWAVNQIQWLIRKVCEDISGSFVFALMLIQPQGDTINTNATLNKPFEIRIDTKDATRSWDAEVWASDHELAFLPRSIKQRMFHIQHILIPDLIHRLTISCPAGATKLCSLKSNLSSIQQRQMIHVKKRRSWFRKGVSFYILQFDLRVIVAPADLRFELWFDGYCFSGNHDPIAVTWD